MLVGRQERYEKNLWHLSPIGSVVCCGKVERGRIRKKDKKSDEVEKEYTN